MPGFSVEVEYARLRLLLYLKTLNISTVLGDRKVTKYELAKLINVRIADSAQKILQKAAGGGANESAN